MASGFHSYWNNFILFTIILFCFQKAAMTHDFLPDLRVYAICVTSGRVVVSLRFLLKPFK